MKVPNSGQKVRPLLFRNNRPILKILAFLLKRKAIAFPFSRKKTRFEGTIFWSKSKAIAFAFSGKKAQFEGIKFWSKSKAIAFAFSRK